jgi:hypothetical protein
MQGDSKKHFEALMSQLGEAQELLEEKKVMSVRLPMRLLL